MTGYRSGPWPGEDGGPARLQTTDRTTGMAVGTAARLSVTSRLAPAATMAITRDPGELFLLRHTAGRDAIAFVERIEPSSLEPLARSSDLPGGPAWPGSVAAHANGSIYVVFGNHAHRLDSDLSVMASTILQRRRPYNGFIIMPDGCLVTKDFAGSRPGAPVPPDERAPCGLVALEPERLEVVGTCALPEPSIARLSADGDMIYVVGDTSLLRVRWRGAFLPDPDFRVRYRTMDGQTYGWDSVIADGAAWFLDDGEGSERFTGTLRGLGLSSAPLHLVRVALASGDVSTAEICGLPGGIVVNPPVVDTARSIAVGYDSGNGVVRAFTIGADGSLLPRWIRNQDHGPHMILFGGPGQLITGDYDRRRGVEQVVILDIATGAELARADTGSPMQSVLFPTVGFERDIYLCSFSTVTRLSVEVSEPSEAPATVTTVPETRGYRFVPRPRPIAASDAER